MSLRTTLTLLARVIADEADKNERFSSQVEAALGIGSPVVVKPQGQEDEARRKGGRRAPAILDPVEVARQSEASLRSRLNALDLEQLRDIVAQYGMDPGKLVMKWRDSERVIERIVELSVARAKKGEAFRSD